MGRHNRGGKKHRRKEKFSDQKTPPPIDVKRREKKIAAKNSQIIERMLSCEHSSSLTSYSCKECAAKCSTKGATKCVSYSKPRVRKGKKRNVLPNST